MAKRQFKAESQKLLDLMIHSIYTHREIFLREIISNASDAMDKLAYISLTDDKVGLNRDDLKITIIADKEARTILVSDTGIGMTKEELSDNLGVIARSGTGAFKEALDETEELDIIGQFGVGFYSAFMVASRVTVISRAYGQETAHKWVSTGADGYSITPCEKETIGTDVLIELRADSPEEVYSDYLEIPTLRGIIKKYSDYIRYPIVLDGEIVNSMVPIWQRPKSDASDEDCFAFYKEKFFDFNDPLAVQRVSAEGTAVSYRAMLFYPAKAPYDYYTRDFKAGLSLYTSGVLIMEHCPALLPEHFRFVRGVVDSSDLSLNISRETLQQDRQVRTIASSLEKKIKSELGRLRDHEPEQYNTLFESFGLQLKYGIVQDYGAKKDLLSDLILFYSAKEEKLISLQTYVDNMPEEQTAIYYACGESADKIAARPQLELVRDKGFDVLYMTDEVDEFVVQILGQYGEKSFKSVYDDDLDLSSEEKKQETEQLEETCRPLLDFVKESLKGEVSAVRLTHKLKSHPVCLGTQGGISLEMEKHFAHIAKQQGTEPVKAERVLELNPEHSVFETLKAAYETDKARAEKLSFVLYQQALLLADLPLAHMTEYVEAFWELLAD